ncbi:uncharacterized protein LOC124936755 [Impatiens glandulifera]|uniref:uncharacterized protein LOC124936755 n=1 Tax=Impatiens glandulifera TaxID=253017 RepID=UPI001FB0786D|nr:uncharacterized protein LOC124936755 [Impatiens glandulifera]
MRSLSTVGLALSLVFGCLFLALMAELYYLIWWKKRISNERDVEVIFCWKKSSSIRSTALNPQEICSSLRMTDTQVYQPLSLLHAHQNKEIWLRQFGEEEGEENEEAVRLRQNISLSGGPPRFLFTIKEETKEEMESEDGRSRKVSRTRSLSDLILTVETDQTPYLTPMASPLYFTPPMTPMDSSSSSLRSPNDFNPLLESSTDTEFRMMKSFLASSPSPPPKFKFLKDAEEKLYRRRLKEEAEKCSNGSSPNSMYLKDEGNGTFISLVIAENKNNNNNNNRGRDLSPEIHKLSSSSTSSQCHSSSLQIVSSTIRSISV